MWISIINRINYLKCECLWSLFIRSISFGTRRIGAFEFLMVTIFLQAYDKWGGPAQFVVISSLQRVHWFSEQWGPFGPSYTNFVLFIPHWMFKLWCNVMLHSQTRQIKLTILLWSGDSLHNRLGYVVLYIHVRCGSPCLSSPSRCVKCSYGFTILCFYAEDPTFFILAFNVNESRTLPSYSVDVKC